MFVDSKDDALKPSLFLNSQGGFNAFGFDSALSLDENARSLVYTSRYVRNFYIEYYFRNNPKINLRTHGLLRKSFEKDVLSSPVEIISTNLGSLALDLEEVDLCIDQVNGASLQWALTHGISLAGVVFSNLRHVDIHIAYCTDMMRLEEIHEFGTGGRTTLPST